MTNNKTLSELASDKCELEMTPMIDVTFLLLIFFMCTLKFKVLEGKLGAYLPKDVGILEPMAPPLEKVDIQIKVTRPGTKVRWDAAAEKDVPYTQADALAGRRFSYGEDRRLEYRVGGRATDDLAEVVQRLRLLKLSDPELKATIHAVDGTVHKDVVEILDSALAAGFDNITFRAAGD